MSPVVECNGTVVRLQHSILPSITMNMACIGHKRRVLQSIGRAPKAAFRDILLSTLPRRAPVAKVLPAESKRVYSILAMGSEDRTLVCAASAATAAQPSTSQPEDDIVQYLVLRRDLWTEVGWPLGPVIAQACHASIAALTQHLQDPVTQQYVAEDQLDHMHKVTVRYPGWLG